MAIGVETSKINSRSYEKEFTEFIHINLRMVIYLTVNQVNSCRVYICGSLT